MKQFSFSRRIEGTRSPRVRCCRLSVVVTSRLFQSYLGLPFVVKRMGQKERGRKREASKVDIYIWCRASTNLSVCLYIVKERESEEAREKRSFLTISRPCVDGLVAGMPSLLLFLLRLVFRAPPDDIFTFKKEKRKGRREWRENHFLPSSSSPSIFFFFYKVKPRIR